MNLYQLLPPLPTNDYQSLKASIAEHGVQVPVILDEHGNTIDGYHRQKACEELGIANYPSEIRRFASETEKLELVMQLHCRRRQLNQRQKRDLIAAYLIRDSQVADNCLAELIGGVSKNTVASVRAELIHARLIPRHDKLRGRDGKERPSKFGRIIATTPKEVDAAVRVVGDLPDTLAGKTVDLVTAQRRVRHKERSRSWQRPVEPFAHDAIRIFNCRFQELEKNAGLEPGSVNLIFTDIPYVDEFLRELPKLTEFAERLLVDGGIFVSYVGKRHLNRYVAEFGKKLTWAWLANMTWNGPGPVHHPRNCLSKFVPLLVYFKGHWPDKGRWVDSHHALGPPEKEFHPWQKPLSDVEKWVRVFSNPGDLVVDPCAGSFTTAAACLRLGDRRFVGCESDEKRFRAGQHRLVSNASSNANGENVEVTA